MTPHELVRAWVTTNARLGGSPTTATAIIRGIGMTPDRWAEFWSEYPTVRGGEVPRRGGEAAALRAELDRVDEAALAAMLGATPSLRAVVAQTYSRAYWLTVYAGTLRAAAAHRQGAYLAVVAGPGWTPAEHWRTGTVTALARSMSATGDFSAAPVLADALEEAGCDLRGWLDAMRDPIHPWFRSAYVIATLV